jgi:hypothetical protein
MKLCGLIPNIRIHVSRNDLHIPMIILIWNLYFPVFHELRELSAERQEEREGQGTAAKQRVDGSSLPFPPLLRLRRDFTLMTNIQTSNLENYES